MFLSFFVKIIFMYDGTSAGDKRTSRDYQCQIIHDFDLVDV